MQHQQQQTAVYSTAQPQGQVIGATNQHTIVFQQQPYNAAPRESGCGNRERYAGKASVWIGSLKIVGAILAIIFQIGLMVLGLPSAFVGVGIWCGIMYLIPGAFGIGAGRSKSLCLIITYMVLCIVMSVVSTIPMLVYSSVGLGRTNNPYECRKAFRWGYDEYGDTINQDAKPQPPQPYRKYNYDTRNPDERQEGDICAQHRSLMLFLYSVMLLISLLELALMIAGSALCCKVTCCYASGSSRQGQVLAPPGQGITIIQSPGPGHAVQVPTGYNQPAMPPSYASVPNNTGVQYSQPGGGQQATKGTEPPQYERPPAYVPADANFTTNNSNTDEDHVYTEIVN